jgi:hypothetical protein
MTLILGYASGGGKFKLDGVYMFIAGCFIITSHRFYVDVSSSC